MPPDLRAGRGGLHDAARLGCLSLKMIGDLSVLPSILSC